MKHKNKRSTRLMLLTTISALSITLMASGVSAQETTKSSAGGPSKIGKELKLGLGLGGGSFVTGLSAKYWLSEQGAVQGTIGTYGFSGFGLNVDYIHDLATLWEHPVGRLGVSAGGGVAYSRYNLLNFSYNLLGISGILSLTWHFKSVPLELASEWRPTLLIGDSAFSGLGFGAAGGAIRYYF